MLGDFNMYWFFVMPVILVLSAIFATSLVLIYHWGWKEFIGAVKGPEGIKPKKRL